MEQKWWTLIAVCVGIFMLLIDITVVNVALPQIQRSLHSSFSDLQWVVNAYALTLAALLLTAGSIADLVGRKRVFAIGLMLFTAASLVCGLSGTALTLNLARAVQGVGGAIMLATSLALIAHAFRGPDRGAAFAAYGAVIGAAVAIGPLVGGALTSGIGWRWIFFVNVPIGIGAAVLTLSNVAESRDPDATGVDWLGLTTFSGALFLFVYALIEGNDKGWGSTEILGCLAGAAVLLAAFLVAELRQQRPMFDLTLLRRPAFAGVSLVAFTMSGSLFALFLFLTLFIQNVIGYGPFQAGLRFLPLTVPVLLVAPIAGRATVRMPVRLILGVGLVLVAGGLVLMSGLNGSSGFTHLLPGFIVGGIGVGVVNPAIASTAVAVVPHSRSGMASGINNTFRQVGIATGIAAYGAIFQHEVSTRTLATLARSGQLAAVVRGTHGQLQSTFASGSTGRLAQALPPTLRHALVGAFHAAFAGALNEILLIAAAVAVAGAIGGLVLVRRSDFIAADTSAATTPVAV
ncbi:MAG TPA: MFS transporter [Solirubrobacteraceae bacterium]|nr:MFS transporter [Solirubrobacteraceae bacterium]